MFLARVEGSVVATKKEASMNGRKLLILRPQLVDEKDPTKFRPRSHTTGGHPVLGRRAALAPPRGPGEWGLTVKINQDLIVIGVRRRQRLQQDRKRA